MKKLLFLLAPLVYSQPVNPVLIFTVNPAGTSCPKRRVATDATDGHFLYCNSLTGLWVDISAGNVPSGNAGGSLTGTYPNPTLANNAINLGTSLALTGQLTPVLGGVGANTGAPQWLRYLGDGSGGASNCSGSLAAGEYWYSSFTISGGNTCSVNSGVRGAIIIRSTGVCTIAGTLNARGSDLGSTTGDSGGSGGGGGGGTGAGTVGAAAQIASWSNTIVAGGTAGTSSGGLGGNGGTPSATYQKLAVTTVNTLRGSGAGGAGGTGAAAAGNGGIPVILACNSINFTGVINASGAVGAPSVANSNGGGGGGGGGIVVLATPTYTANTGEIAVSGGTGGACVNPAIVFGIPATPIAGTLSGSGALAHVSTFATGNPTVITVDAAGSGYNYTPSCTVVGNGGSTGSGATCTATMTGVSPNMTLSSVAVSGGNAGYSTGLTFTTCGRGGDGGAGWSMALTAQ